MAIQAPVLEYAQISGQKLEEIGKYFEGVDSLSAQYVEFWKQTELKGRKVIELVKAEGFVIGSEVNTRGLAHRWVYCPVYPAKLKDDSSIIKPPFEDELNRLRIGRIGLWEFEGFSSKPVQVWHTNPDLVDDSIALRTYLRGKNVDFIDVAGLESYRGEIKTIEERLVQLKRAVSKLELLK